AVPVVRSAETVVAVRGDAVLPVTASDPLALAQTPHAFAAPVLRAAHRDRPEPRDDATLLVNLGARVVAVPGEPTNMHITTQDDLSIAIRLLPLGVTERDRAARH